MRILLVPNVHSERAAARAAEALAWLTAVGMAASLTSEDAAALGMGEPGVDVAEAAASDLVVALGGDGTILKAVRLLDGAEVPVLGVHMGRLGFMSGAQEGELREAVEAALAGEARIERRSTLRVEVRTRRGAVDSRRALNEAFIGRGGGNRSVAVRVSVNGVEVGDYTCDGVIVATPTGSTAYALSAGGPVVAPDVGALLVVPVAPHTVTVRPILAGPSDVVEVALSDPERAEARVTVDGEPVDHGTEAVELLSVSRDPSDVLLVRHSARSFYEAYRDEFLGG